MAELKVVRQAGNAPASAVWKTAVLLLNDCRIFKMAVPARFERATFRSSGEHSPI